MTGWRKGFVMIAVAAVLVTVLSANQALAGGFSFSLSFNRPGTQYIPGHWEAQTQAVLISPAHWETRWIQQTNRVLVPTRGWVDMSVPTVSYQRVYVPAQYEYQTVNVWVPGYWTAGNAAVNIRVLDRHEDHRR